MSAHVVAVCIRVGEVLVRIVAVQSHGGLRGRSSYGRSTYLRPCCCSPCRRMITDLSRGLIPVSFGVNMQNHSRCHRHSGGNTDRWSTPTAKRVLVS